MLIALQGHFTTISSKVRKLRWERERSLSTAGQTMTEPEKSSDIGEMSAVTGRLEVGYLPDSSHFQSFVVPTNKHQKCKTNMVLSELQ